MSTWRRTAPQTTTSPSPQVPSRPSLWNAIPTPSQRPQGQQRPSFLSQYSRDRDRPPTMTSTGFRTGFTPQVRPSGLFRPTPSWPRQSFSSSATTTRSSGTPAATPLPPKSRPPGLFVNGLHTLPPECHANFLSAVRPFFRKQLCKTPGTLLLVPCPDTYPHLGLPTQAQPEPPSPVQPSQLSSSEDEGVSHNKTEKTRPRQCSDSSESEEERAGFKSPPAPAPLKRPRPSPSTSSTFPFTQVDEDPFE